MPALSQEEDVGSCVVFPDDPFFSKLLSAAKRRGNATIIHEKSDGIQANYNQLIHDVHVLRQQIQSNLPDDLLDINGMVKQEGLYIAILAQGGYKFLVACIATLAIGAAAIPLSPEVLPEEAIYVLKKANATLVLLDHSKVELMASIQKQAIASNMNPIGWISIEISRAPLGDTLSVRTDANLTMSPERPALLLLTSGTSGPPKIVVHARRIFYSQPEPCGGPTDVFLFHRPVFWIGGIRMIMAVVLKGIRTEMLCYRAKADAVWERLRQGDITMMFLPVSLLSNMMMVFEEKLCQLPDAELRVYHEIMGNIRYIQCTGGLVPVRIKQFWRNLLTGTSLEVNYAGTEVGTAALGFSINSLEMAESHSIIGKPLPGISVKLSSGDQGDLLIKTPTMFIGYLDNVEATNASFDEEGFFRTGDTVKRAPDGTVFLEGRAQTDYIRYRGLRVPVLEVVACLLDQPFIAEAYVVPVLDIFAGGKQVAIVIRLRKSSLVPAELQEGAPKGSALSLHALRVHLSQFLEEYKLPTILHILGDEQDVPRSQSGKPLLNAIAGEFFPQPLEGSLEGLPAEVQVCRTIIRRNPVAWDWGALRY